MGQKLENPLWRHSVWDKMKSQHSFCLYFINSYGWWTFSDIVLTFFPLLRILCSSSQHMFLMDYPFLWFLGFFFLSSLYTLDIDPLSDRWLILFQSMCFLFTWLFIFLTAQKIFCFAKFTRQLLALMLGQMDSYSEAAFLHIYYVGLS